MQRPKPLLTYFILCAIPLLLLAGLNYWNGFRTLDSTLSTTLQNDLDSLNVAVDEVLNRRKNDILRLSITPEVQDVLIKRQQDPLSVLTKTGSDLALKALPHPNEQFHVVTLFDGERKPLFLYDARGEWQLPYTDAKSLPTPDPSLWETQGNVLSEKPGSVPAMVQYGAPVHDKSGINVGAVVGILDLARVVATAARGLGSRDSTTSMVLVVDRSGQAVYPDTRSGQIPKPPTLQDAEPLFHAMANNQSGLGQFRSGDFKYLAAYAPFPQLDLAVAVGRRRSDFASAAHLRGIAGLAVALLCALAAAFLLNRHVQKRTRGMARVNEDLSAIAKGELDRRIILQSSDDARGIADNINTMTERLRAQIEREEESRQFESFVRLSAMLTHDLKNAIEGLSLTVSNMERHFDNPQFRADAMKGLTNATEKLKALVARLARPLTSLSGEHKRPTNIDLVPILKRVIAMTAEPMRNKFTIVTRLPQNLYVLADAARIEEVVENLILNALEAMEKGGTLTIEAGQTTSGAPAFSVSDTGRGMSQVFINTRLFRPFATTKKTGIGIGLYTCREVIKASGGSIEVESVEDAGTTFRVVLPSPLHNRRN